jgi:hypothetical protein
LNFKSLALTFLIGTLIGVFQFSPVRAATTFTVSSQEEFIEALEIAGPEDTILLDADFSVEMGYHYVEGEIVIDGGNHTLTCSGGLFYIGFDAKVSIKNLTIAGSSDVSQCVLMWNYGKLNVNAVSVTKTWIGHNEGYLEIKNSTFTNGAGVNNGFTGVAKIVDTQFSQNTGNYWGLLYNEGSFDLQNVTISGGSIDRISSAIWNSSGILNITDSVIKGNSDTYGQALPVIAVVEGNVNLVRTQLLDNVGTAIELDPLDEEKEINLTINDSTFARNSEGAVKGRGTVSVIGSKFEDNNGIAIDLDYLQTEEQTTLAVTDSIFNRNTQGAIKAGGSIHVVRSKFEDNQGVGIEVISSDTEADSTLIVTDSLLSRHSKPAITIERGSINVLRTEFLENVGGIVFDFSLYGTNDALTVSESVFSGNEWAGAIEARGIINISRSTFTGNSSSAFGGAVNLSGTATISDSTFNSNFTTYATEGGGGAIAASGNVTIANVTMSGNSTGIYGGGILSLGDLTVTHSTIVNNSAYTGGAVYSLGGTVSISNSILSNTAENECENFSKDTEVINAVNNLAGDECGTAPITNLDLTLKDNGGKTRTHALLPGSNAINAAGDCSAAPVNGVDQRGITRDTQCDIGSYEYVEAAPTATQTSVPATVQPTSTSQPTLEATATSTLELTATTDVPTLTSTLEAPSPTVTASIEATVTNEETAVPPTASAEATLQPTETTPPPTETPSPSGELLTNAGFEDGVNGWTLKNGSSDKVKCNKVGKIVSYEGSCAFQFKGSEGEASKLQQEVVLSTLSLKTGDTLTLSGFVDAKGAVKAVMNVTVTYATTKGKISAKISTPTSGYQALSSAPLTLVDTPLSIKIQISNRSTSGRIRVDALKLEIQTPLMALPE